MTWILHHWPALWALYDPAAIRVLVALAIAVEGVPLVLLRRI